MEIWQAIVLGLVQGLTEFLPVSSSGHLVFFQQLMNVDLEGGAMFLGVMLHVGTLISLCIVFFKDILGLFKKPFHTLFFLFIASIPAAVVGLAFGDAIDGFFYGGEFLCYGFLLTAIVLLLTEWMGKRTKEPKELGWKSALVMGAAQAVAVIPGISRSGSTIAAGTFCKVKRDGVAKFSFLMSIPVIGGAALVEIFKIVRDGTVIPSSDVAAMLVGVAVAAVSGYLAIRFMLKVIAKADYKWFSLYLFAMAIFTFVNNFVHFL